MFVLFSIAACFASCSFSFFVSVSFQSLSLSRALPACHSLSLSLSLSLSASSSAQEFTRHCDKTMVLRSALRQNHVPPFVFSAPPVPVTTLLVVRTEPSKTWCVWRRVCFFFRFRSLHFSVTQASVWRLVCFFFRSLHFFVTRAQSFPLWSAWRLLLSLSLSHILSLIRSLSLRRPPFTSLFVLVSALSHTHTHTHTHTYTPHTHTLCFKNCPVDTLLAVHFATRCFTPPLGQ